MANIKFSSEGDVAVLHDAQALVTFHSATETGIGDITAVDAPTPSGKAQIKFWGKNNALPLERETLLSESSVAPALISTKRNITVGLDVFAYTEVWENGERKILEQEMPPEIALILENSGGKKFFIESADELLKHANVFTEFLCEDGGKVSSLKNLKCRHVRAEQQDEFGRINNYYWRGDGFIKKADEKRDFPISIIPNYQKDGLQNKFILHEGDSLFTDEYYFIPSWWGSRIWIELSNLIPKFHAENMKNSYTIKYHIKIPKYYLEDAADNTLALTTEQKQERKQKIEAKKTEVLGLLNDFLAGLNGTGRAFYSTYDVIKATGQAFPGIEIIPLKVDLLDDALLKLFEKANQAVMGGMQVHPTLANIETAGKLSSGSEMRNAYTIYLAIHTPILRDILLRPLYIIKYINKLDIKLKFGFRDLTLTTLDNDKAGFQATTPTA